MKMRTIDGYEVRECPFCGKIDTIDFADIKSEEMCSNCYEEDKCPHYGEYECKCGCFVVCSHIRGGCGASSGWGSDKETAVEIWNRRA